MKNWLSQEALGVARSNAQTITRKAGELNGWDCIDYPVAETLLALLDARVSSDTDKARIAELDMMASNLRGLISDLWWFIENVNYETPYRTERFFALRGDVRAALAKNAPQTAAEPQIIG